MPKFPLKLPQIRRIFRRSAPLVLTFLLSSAQLAHTYAPCALACVALAGPGLSGLLALLGAAGGTFLFFDFQPGLRFLASAILIYAASTAFYDTRLYTHPLFRPAVAAAMTALVQSIWDVDVLVIGGVGVADTSQHISNRVSDVHNKYPPSLELQSVDC